MSKVNSNLNDDLETEIATSAIVVLNQSHNIIVEDAEKDIALKTNEKIKLNSVLDIKNICRACLCAEKNMISLFSFDNSEVLANMFLLTTAIKIESEENLPLQVCESCKGEIIKSYNFKLKCCKSDSYLRSFTDTERKPKSIQDLSHSDASANIINYGDEKYIKKECDIELKPDIEEQDIEYLEEEVFGDVYLLQKNDNEIDRKKFETSESNEYYKKIPTRKKNKKRKKQLQCEICFKTFLKTKTLKAHFQQNHSQTTEIHRPFPCEQCKESFNCEHDLHLHSAVHIQRNNVWTCNKCDKQFTVKNGLRRHIQRHMEWKRYACGACGKAFAELCALRRHARVHTGERQEKRFPCRLCDKKFMDRSQLSAHVARHTGERSFACERCGKAFRSRRLLASHGRVHSDLKPYACLYCPKRFRHESTLSTHHRTHTGEKPYVCSICAKTFIQHSNLTLHMRTHTGEKPYSCDFCGRKFSSGSSLNSHRRTHTGEKPYSCPICGKRFARTDIQTHLRRHTGERPFACCVCSKSFASAARLRDHHLIHTGEKAFECAICSKKYKRKSYLARHLKWHQADSKFKYNEMFVLRTVPLMVDDKEAITNDDSGKLGESESIVTMSNKDTTGSTLEGNEVPLEVSQELILDDSDVKNEVVVVDEGPHSVGYQNEVICLDAPEAHFESQNMDLVTVNQKGISDSTAIINGSPVNLYQVDRSLMQVETMGGQVMIRKITSKMTANF